MIEWKFVYLQQARLTAGPSLYGQITFLSCTLKLCQAVGRVGVPLINPAK